MAGITAIAAGVSLATTAATTGASFAQAHKQKMAMQKARTSANRKKRVGFPLVSKLGPISSLIR